MEWREFLNAYAKEKKFTTRETEILLVWLAEKEKPLAHKEIINRLSINVNTRRKITIDTLKENFSNIYQKSEIEIDKKEDQALSYIGIY